MSNSKTTHKTLNPKKEIQIKENHKHYLHFKYLQQKQFKHISNTNIFVTRQQNRFKSYYNFTYSTF